MNILIFGDSVAQGFWDSYGGWVQRLAHNYHADGLRGMLTNGSDYPEVFNLGVTGDTVEEVAKRIEPESKARLSGTKTIIVIAVGINDSRLHNNRAFMDVYNFQSDFDKVLKKALKITPHVLCVGLSAVDDAKTDPWPYSLSKKQWSNNRINAFEDTVKQSAELKDLPFVAVHDQFLAALEAGQDLLADGLHPNEAGHQLIAELVKPSLDALIAK